MYHQGEMLWPQFVQMDWVRRLPLHEQVVQYNMYLENLSTQLQTMQMNSAAGGTAPIPEPTSDVLPSNCIEFVNNTTFGTNSLISFTTLGPVNFTLDWGDGTVDTGTADGESTNSHTYADADQSYTCRLCFDNIGLVTILDFAGND
jgi:hypothetical protein